MIFIVIGTTLAAAVGTMAFFVLFHGPMEEIWRCGFVGGLGWAIYLTAFPLAGAVAASFLATAVIALSARILAVLRRTPNNIFLIPGIFPLVPGKGIYDSIYGLLTGGQVADTAMETMKIVGVIVLGIVVVFTLPGHLFRAVNRFRRSTKN